MNSAYRLLKALLLVLWPPTLAAATAIPTLDLTLTGVSVGVWVIIFVISTMGGLTSLLHKLKTEIPPRMVLYVFSHMFMAWFAGSLAFFILEVRDTHDLIEIPLIGLASYLGARLVDMFTDKFFTWISTVLDALTKSKPSK